MQNFDGRNLTGFQAQSIVYNMNAVKLARWRDDP